MALTFGALGTDRVDSGTLGSLHPAVWTSLLWIYPTTLSIFRGLHTKGNVTTEQGPAIFGLRNPSDELQVVQSRATTNLIYTSSNANLTTDKWWCVAGQVDESGPSAHIWVGDLATPLTEVSYTTTENGSGAFTSGASDTFRWGTNTANDLAWRGRLAYGLFINRALSLNELVSLQFRPRNVADMKILHVFGYNGTGTQQDYSGNGNVGTVTGATVANHVPLPNPFAWDMEDDPYLIAAALGFTPRLPLLGVG